MAVTLATVLGKVRREVDNPAGPRILDESLVDDINQAVRVVMRRIAAIWPDYYLRTGETQVSTYTITAAKANYDLPDILYLVIQVVTTDSSANNTIREPLTLDRTLDADADGYYLRDDDLWLYPIPSVTVASGLVIRYLARPAEVTVLTSYVPLADDFLDAIVTWAVIKTKARQEKASPDYAAVYKLIRDQMDSLTARTNLAHDDRLHTEWRNFI